MESFYYHLMGLIDNQMVFNLRHDLVTMVFAHKVESTELIVLALFFKILIAKPSECLVFEHHLHVV